LPALIPYAPFIVGGLTTGGILGSAKLQANATRNSAKLQTDAANKAAEIQAKSSAAQLASLKEQAELDRLSKQFADKQNFYLSNARDLNSFGQYSDTSTNSRNSEISQGRTQDKIYGGRQNQMNYMRAMLGMPQNELSVYVEPDALQLTRPTLPDYVEDTTPTRTT
jgi:hypothetical protein